LCGQLFIFWFFFLQYCFPLQHNLPASECWIDECMHRWLKFSCRALPSKINYLKAHRIWKIRIFSRLLDSVKSWLILHQLGKKRRMMEKEKKRGSRTLVSWHWRLFYVCVNSKIQRVLESRQYRNHSGSLGIT